MIKINDTVTYKLNFGLTWRTATQEIKGIVLLVDGKDVRVNEVSATYMEENPRGVIFYFGKKWAYAHQIV